MRKIIKDKPKVKKKKKIKKKMYKNNIHFK